jgi:molecular chaperone HtpG
LTSCENSRKDILESYGSSNKIVKQLIDLALLSNNMLRGEELSVFVKRSVELL